MSWLDYLLLALIGGYCAYLLLRRKKKDGCCGDCSRCGGCGRRCLCPHGAVSGNGSACVVLNPFHNVISVWVVVQKRTILRRDFGQRWLAVLPVVDALGRLRGLLHAAIPSALRTSLVPMLPVCASS